MTPRGGLLALLALLACDGGYEPVQPPSCVDSNRWTPGCVYLSGTGSTGGTSRLFPFSDHVGELAGGPYICRAEISGNIGTSPDTPTDPGLVSVSIFGGGGGAYFNIEIIDEDAAAAAWGEARFAAPRVDIRASVIASPRSRWALACEPDAVP